MHKSACDGQKGRVKRVSTSETGGWLSGTLDVRPQTCRCQVRSIVQEVRQRGIGRDARYNSEVGRRKLINRKFASKPGFGGKDRDLLASLDAAGLQMVRAGCDDGAAKRH